MFVSGLLASKNGLYELAYSFCHVEPGPDVCAISGPVWLAQPGFGQTHIWLSGARSGPVGAKHMMPGLVRM